ncbi:MAG: tetratricopeptide repeat protein [Gammaproteobacteria bacterium]|nr:MAG: tetratricopeptide repeat protein [Gammaproteobacteria bacterium]
MVSDRVAGIKIKAMGWKQKHGKWGLLPPVMLVLVLVAILYGQVLGHQFLHWDDIGFYIQNPMLYGFTAEHLWWIATSSGDGIWKPLTWLTFMVEFQLIPMDMPGLHLLVNPLIHAANAILLGLITRRVLALHGPLFMDAQRASWAAWLAAVLFAIHPVQVEAAAWLAGRKEVLCAFFYLLAVWGWLRWLVSSERRWFWLTVVFHVLAIVSKPMAVTVPGVLLILDMVARRPQPLWRLVLEKWPFAIISALIVPVAIWGQLAVDALPDTALVPPLVRYAQGVDSYLAYLAKGLLPLNVAPYYPALDVIDGWRLVAGTVVMLLLPALAWRDWYRGSRFWFFVIAWYLVVFSPVCGWLQVGAHRVADRYAYLPMVSVYIAMAVAVVRYGKPVVAALASAVMVMVLAWLGYQQVGLWKDDRSLWEFTVATQAPSAVIYNNLGSVRYDSGDYAGAAQAYRAAVALQPTAPLYRNLLLALQQSAQWENFLGYAQEASAAFPDDAFLYVQPGTGWIMLGEYDAALQFYDSLSAGAQQDTAVLWGRAYAFANLQRTPEALATLDQLLQLVPDHVGAQQLKSSLATHSASD